MKTEIDTKSILRAEDVHLSYGPTHALAGATIDIRTGEIVGLSGKSGSGKSSLLYCLAGIIRPDRGRVRFLNHDLMTLDDDERSALRRQHFGFVFQFGELVPELSLQENVALPLRLNGANNGEARAQTAELLERLGIRGIAHKRPGEVSGGQAQRAAVARGLVHAPEVIFADEPTGSLDVENSEIVLNEFISLARTSGTSVVLVTHEPNVAAVCDRQFQVVDGTVRAPISP